MYSKEYLTTHRWGVWGGGALGGLLSHIRLDFRAARSSQSFIFTLNKAWANEITATVFWSTNQKALETIRLISLPTRAAVNFLVVGSIKIPLLLFHLRSHNRDVPCNKKGS